MASLAPDVAAVSARPRVPAGLLAALALFAAAFALRAPMFGNPMLYVDEQFYLLVGDRMLHGALPYVDLWDRKPIGLFLIYAAIRLLGGSGIVEYQVVATLFAGATACAIQHIARRAAGAVGGMIAGLLYLLYLQTTEGGGGQAPVFYNLFVAGAAACTFAAWRSGDDRAFARLALAAMALAGIAIQVKYTALFESAYFGLLLGWQCLRRAPSLVGGLARTAILALAALSPTLLALTCYAAMGEARAFWFANFTSIFLRAPADPRQVHFRLLVMAFYCAPLIGSALAGAWQLRRHGDGQARDWLWLVAGWCAAALAGFFSVGMLFIHYLQPLLVPLTIAAAPMLRRPPVGWLLGLALVGVPLWQVPSVTPSTPYYRARQDELAALLPADVRSGCMHMFAGPPSLYLRTGACTRTAYLFPNHLVSRLEVPALGMDAMRELRRLLASRPRALITDDHAPELEPRHYGLVKRAIRRDYRLAGSVQVADRRLDVWLTR